MSSTYSSCLICLTDFLSKTSHSNPSHSQKLILLCRKYLNFVDNVQLSQEDEVFCSDCSESVDQLFHFAYMMEYYQEKVADSVSFLEIRHRSGKNSKKTCKIETDHINSGKDSPNFECGNQNIIVCQNSVIDNFEDSLLVPVLEIEHTEKVTTIQKNLTEVNYIKSPVEEKEEVKNVSNSEETEKVIIINGKGCLESNDKEEQMDVMSTSSEHCLEDLKFSTTESEHKDQDDISRKYVCKVCQKGFKSEKLLKVHARVHSEERPFICKVCSKGFKWKCNLTEHKTMHTGDLPHDCDICGKKFRKKYSLKEHRKGHSAEKPFKCNECDYSSARKAHLESHKMFKHSTMHNFKCSVCNKPFKRLYDAKLHYKKIHSALDYSDDSIIKTC